MMQSFTKLPRFGEIRILLIMKLTFIFVLVALLEVSANSYSQNPKLSLVVNDAGIKTIFKEIRSKSDFTFLYRSDLLKGLPKMSINVKEATIEEIMQQLLVKHGLEYEIDDRTVIIRESAVADFGKELTGKIIDQETGQPMPGATIMIKGTATGEISDVQGNFSINVDEGQTLIISFVGYSTEEYVVGSASQITIEMVPDISQLSSVVVIGSRGRPRTIMESPVPVDNINAEELKTSGQSSVEQMLTFKIPSYNSTNQAISDATAHFDPSELRNLGPSRTLVLINGKRKNQSAQVYVNETPGRGEVGVDMKGIPGSSIERIEVLRDGASAQYGSDAIAGVINVVLKDDADGGEVNAGTGVTAEGDGLMYNFDVNKGLSIGSNGFLNLTGSFYHQDYTDRANEPGGDGLFGFLYNVGAIPIGAAGGFEATPGNVATGLQILNGDTDFQRANPDNGMIVGQPEYDKYSGVANFGLSHGNGGEFYINGAYTFRRGTSFALYRVPWWPGIPTNSTDNPLYDGNGIYQGFHPTFETDINDMNLTVGNLFRLNEWSIDVSGTTGSNIVNYKVGNSINPGLGASSPTSFDPGGYSFGNMVGNIDVSRSINKLDVSFGMEARKEKYEVRAGQEESYISGGVSSFPGLQPGNALEEDRTNVGFYTGLDFDVSQSFLIGGAIRFENYSDFGNNVSWKLNARQMLGSNGAIRASVSTGFRAPSLHQIYLSNVQTLVVGGNVQQEGTFNNVDPVTRDLLGVPELSAERSFNFTTGISYNILSNLSLSLDYYSVKVEDRILFSNQISTGALPAGNPVRAQLETEGVEAFKFFVNALDTRTSGIDVVLSLDKARLGDLSTLDLTFALNSNKTKIDGEINAPTLFQTEGIEIFNREEKARVTSTRPSLRFSLSAGLNFDKLHFHLNNTYFGEVEWKHPVDPVNDQTFAAKVLTDLIVGYDITDKFNVGVTINNLLDVYPDEIDAGTDFETDLGGRFKYPWEVNQFGFLGRVYKLGVSYKF